MTGASSHANISLVTVTRPATPLPGSHRPPTVTSFTPIQSGNFTPASWSLSVGHSASLQLDGVRKPEYTYSASASESLLTNFVLLKSQPTPRSHRLICWSTPHKLLIARGCLFLSSLVWLCKNSAPPQSLFLSVWSRRRPVHWARTPSPGPCFVIRSTASRNVMSSPAVLYDGRRQGAVRHVRLALCRRGPPTARRPAAARRRSARHTARGRRRRRTYRAPCHPCRVVSRCRVSFRVVTIL